MSTRLWKLLLFTGLIAATLSYVFFLNPEPATIHWGPGPARVWTTPMALLLVTVFAAGVATEYAVALLIGARVQFYQWRSARLQRAREGHLNRLVVAREELALGNTESARKELLGVLQRDPVDVHALISMANSFRTDDKPLEALRVLEAAPLALKSNREVLMKVATIHRESGNRLAACDALRLLLARDPKNIRLLRELTDLSSALEKFHDAADYAEQAVRAARTPAERTNALDRLAQAELLRAKAESGTDRLKLRTALNELLRRHQEYGPALRMLAHVEREELNLEAAQKLFARAFRVLRSVELLGEIAQLWLTAEEPRRALAAVRNLVQDPGTAPKLDGQLFLAGLVLLYGDATEANREIAACRSINGVPPERTAEILVLEAMAARQSENAERALDALFQAVGLLLPSSPLRLLRNATAGIDDKEGSWAEQARLAYRSHAEPAPRLLGR